MSQFTPASLFAPFYGTVSRHYDCMIRGRVIKILFNYEGSFYYLPKYSPPYMFCMGYSGAHGAIFKGKANPGRNLLAMNEEKSHEWTVKIWAKSRFFERSVNLMHVTHNLKFYQRLFLSLVLCHFHTFLSICKYVRCSLWQRFSDTKEILYTNSSSTSSTWPSILQ